MLSFARIGQSAASRQAAPLNRMPFFKKCNVVNNSSARHCATKAQPSVKTPSLMQSLATGYATLLGANFISNMMIHPTQKIDYGVLNSFYPDNREVDLPFWGTRLPHLFAIPACLLFYDHTVSAVFTRYFGMVSFAATPSLFLVNLFCYTWLAVGTFIGADAALNPHHEGHRIQHLQNCIKPLTIGMSLQWHLPLMLEVFGSASTGVVAIVRNAFAVALVFLPVKSLGFGDFGTSGLSPHERVMNGLEDKDKN